MNKSSPRPSLDNQKNLLLATYLRRAGRCSRTSPRPASPAPDRCTGRCPTDVRDSAPGNPHRAGATLAARDFALTRRFSVPTNDTATERCCPLALRCCSAVRRCSCNLCSLQWKIRWWIWNGNLWWKLQILNYNFKLSIESLQFQIKNSKDDNVNFELINTYVR